MVDDARQGVTQVVRGDDLLDSTPRQMLIQDRLGLPRPEYAHLPVLVDVLGRKLGKSTGAESVDDQPPARCLRHVLGLLGHAPPPATTTLDALWSWALEHWRLEQVPRGPVEPGVHPV